jgi:uncharacterized membrane protein (DUF2068 family)
MADAVQNVQTGPPKKAPTLYLIIFFKLVKGTLALILAFLVYKYRNDLPDVFLNVLRFMHLDPENRFLSGIGDQLDKITPASIRGVAWGLLLYSLFALVEGVGLIFRVPWAGWLTIGESAFFIPIEIYELMRHLQNHQRGLPTRPGVTWKISVILALNIIIVWYLYQNRARLFRHK